MSLKRFLRWLRLRRMERRGEAVVNAEVFWDSIRTLAEDLVPGPDNEISRDLFAILAFEPPRVCRRPFGLSYAATAGPSSMA